MIENRAGHLQVDHGEQLIFWSFSNGIDSFEMRQKCMTGFGPHAGNFIQLRTESGLAAALAVVVQRKPVRFIAQVLNQFERGGTFIQEQRMLIAGVVNFFQSLCDANDGNFSS